MCTEQKNTKKLKELYRESLAIKSAIPHPRILGIIRECGGKMHIAERNFGDADGLFEAFRVMTKQATETGGVFKVSRVSEHVDAIRRRSVRVSRGKIVSNERGSESDDGFSPSVPSERHCVV